ncbi:hypothetical protein LTR49_026850 [Elasticomyces elasticus]|nr:hypothetical protein LTR49_026850 [Elasticomyces elasticus]
MRQRQQVLNRRHVKVINYFDLSTIVESVKGQNALAISLNGMIYKDTETKLLEAADKAGVKWVLAMRKRESRPFHRYKRMTSTAATRKAIADLGKSSYLAVSIGSWYKWSVAIGPPSASIM